MSSDAPPRLVYTPLPSYFFSALQFVFFVMVVAIGHPVIGVVGALSSVVVTLQGIRARGGEG